MSKADLGLLQGLRELGETGQRISGVRPGELSGWYGPWPVGAQPGVVIGAEVFNE